MGLLEIKVHIFIAPDEMVCCSLAPYSPTPHCHLKPYAITPYYVSQHSSIPLFCWSIFGDHELLQLRAASNVWNSTIPHTTQKKYSTPMELKFPGLLPSSLLEEA